MLRFPWRRRDREIADEINTHIAMATRDRIERGETPEAARAAAMREFGNVAMVRQTTREVWSWTSIEHLVQDMRFGARILWNAPGLSATAIVLIALVIGGNTTIYTIVHGILTSPARGVTAERLVTIKHVVADRVLNDPYVSYPNYLDYRRASTTTRGLIGWSGERMTLTTDTGSYALYAALVTSNYFETFGIGMAMGRPITDEHAAVAGTLPAVISERVWRERFGAAHDVLGRAISINGIGAVVIGVTGAGFVGATMTPAEDVWLPIERYYDAVGTREILTNRRQPLVIMAAQLAPEASLRRAGAEFETLSAQLRAAYPADFKEDVRAQVSNYSGTSLLPVADMAPYFLALFSVVTVLTLVIVSANVANLMLGRAVVRQRDTAVRQSLGASRLRIVRMLLSEGVAIAITACVAAYVFAWWVSRAVVRVIEPTPGLLPDFRPDWVVASYALLLAMVATIAFSLAPALRSWRQPVLPLLKSGEHSVAPGRSRLSNTLVILQLAFSVLLLTSAGLAYRSLSLLDSGDVGFTSDNLLLVTLRTARSGSYIAREPTAAEREARFALLERVRERLAVVANIESVSYARRTPGAYFLAVTPVRRVGDTDSTSIFLRQVGPDYLRTLGLRPLAGREFTAADRQGAPRGAVINKHLADALWPGRSPLGQTLLLTDGREPVEIIGVAPNALFDGPTHNEDPRYVLIAEQQLRGNPAPDPSFYVRYRGGLEALTPTITRAIAEVDADLPIVTMATMNAKLDTVTALEEIVTTFLLLFALPSLVIAALGQYAVTMFNIRRRTRDFGVRLALGASAAQIQRDVVRESLKMTTIGLAVGFVLSAAVGVAGESMLFGVTPTDPPTYAGVFAVLALASLAASYVPAWRAGRVSVVEALRQE